MADGARRREAESAGTDGVGRDTAHGGDVGLGRGLVADGALAHHVDADGGVRKERAQVDVALLAIERGDVLAERLPLPVEPLVHDRAWNVLDALHQLDQLLSVGRFARREANAAVAHHRRGDAVPRRRRHVAIPDGLAVVVGVNIDEAGRDDTALGVDLFGAAVFKTSDGPDASAAHGNIALAGRSPSSVNDRPLRMTRSNRVPIEALLCHDWPRPLENPKTSIVCQSDTTAADRVMAKSRRSATTWWPASRCWQWPRHSRWAREARRRSQDALRCAYRCRLRIPMCRHEAAHCPEQCRRPHRATASSRASLAS